MDDSVTSKLDRCLTTLDLTALGVGATLGVGIYVLSGQVARELAGPSVVLSFIIAGIASALSGLCYAEMGARVPKAGSAYVYSYVTMGEGVALVIGWNLVLEYAIGTASVARGYSGYLDNLLGHKMEHFFRRHFPFDLPYLSPFPDFCAFGITMLLASILSVGVKLSSSVNKVFTSLNVVLMTFVTVVGLWNADLANWSVQGGQTANYTIAVNDSSSSSLDDEGSSTRDAVVGFGGFFPFGISGTLAGAATCFYGFVGFDSIATSGEEALNPQRSIPLAIVGSLAVVCLAYIGVSCSLTLMTPYYLQDLTAPLPAAFQSAGMDWVATIVGIGALLGLSTSLLGAMFPLPRILYAMASDGILFRWLSTVNETLMTPVYATLLSGFFVGTLAAILELQSLVDMMSIGTLMAYTMVAVCVLVLRYQNSPGSLGDYLAMEHFGGEKRPLSNGNGKYMNGNGVRTQDHDTDGSSDEELVYSHRNEDRMDLIGRKRKLKLMQETEKQQQSVGVKAFLLQMFNLPRLRTPTQTSSQVARTMGLMAAKFAVSFAGIIALGLERGHGFDEATGELKKTWMFPLVFMPSMTAFCMVCVWLQPVSEEALNFRVPLVPLLPVVSIFVNAYLMMKLSAATWIRFAAWMLVGLAIYAGYGWRNSSEEYRHKGLVPPNEMSPVASVRSKK